MAAAKTSRKTPKSAAKGRPSHSAGKGGPLSKKIGGVPVWGWAAGVLAAILVGLWLRNRGSSAATTPDSTTSTGSAAPASASAPGTADGTGSDASDIQALQGELAAVETQLGFGLGAYIQPAEIVQGITTLSPITIHPPGAPPASPAAPPAPGHRKYAGPAFVQAALPKGASAPSRKRTLLQWGLPEGASMPEIHAQNLNLAGKLGAQAQAHATAARGMSKLPALSVSPPTHGHILP